MPFEIALLQPRPHACPYLEGREARDESFLAFNPDPELFSTLVECGYRHFGQFFFRPACRGCHACLPLRVPTAGYRFPRSAAKAFSRNADLDIRIAPPVPSREAHELYLKHKERFRETEKEDTVLDDFAAFRESFFCPFPFSAVLEMRLGGRLVCASHFDCTDRVLSAVYCYYDPAEAKRGLGTLAVYAEIRAALERGVPYVYLGYCIEANRHMAYKRRYRPNQVLLREGCWVDHTDAGNRPVAPPEGESLEFRPRPRFTPVASR